jgi:hypothetical protein
MQKRPKSSSAEIASLPLSPVEFEDSPFSPRQQDHVEKPSMMQQLLELQLRFDPWYVGEYL